MERRHTVTPPVVRAQQADEKDGDDADAVAKAAGRGPGGAATGARGRQPLSWGRRARAALGSALLGSLAGIGDKIICIRAPPLAKFRFDFQRQLVHFDCHAWRC